MLHLSEIPAPAVVRAGAGSRTRPAPLPPMRLSPSAQAGLIALRVLLALSATMAVFATLHAPTA